MLTIRNTIFAACLATSILIGPASDETERGVPVLLAPGEFAPTTEQLNASVVHGRIDAARYGAAPAVDRNRSTPLWLTVTATLTLALAALSPKRATLAVIGVALAWSIGLAAALAMRPAIDRVPAADGTLWLIARRPGTASVPIVDGTPWVPVVESSRHWQTLAPRVVVREGHQSLELTLPAPGSRVALSQR